MNYYRRQQLLKNLIVLGGILVVFFIGSLFFKLIVFSPEKSAEQAIHVFYQHEEAGNFSQSWEMFHPIMQEKFSKNQYIQDRAHVFLNHFGIEAFQVSFGKTKKLKSWTISEEREPLRDVYIMPITMHIKGKYGILDIRQDVFAIKIQDKWKILWDYEQE